MAQPQTALAVTKARPGAMRGDGGKRWAPVLESVPPFAAVPKRQLRKIAALTREARHRRGTAIVRVGDRGDDVDVVLDGSASVVRASRRSPSSCSATLLLASASSSRRLS